MTPAVVDRAKIKELQKRVAAVGKELVPGMNGTPMRMARTFSRRRTSGGICSIDCAGCVNLHPIDRAAVAQMEFTIPGWRLAALTQGRQQGCGKFGQHKRGAVFQRPAFSAH